MAHIKNGAMEPDYDDLSQKDCHALTAFFYEYARALPQVQEAIKSWRKQYGWKSERLVMSMGNAIDKMEAGTFKLGKDVKKAIAAQAILKAAPPILQGSPLELLIFLYCFRPFPDTPWNFSINDEKVLHWEAWWQGKCKNYNPLTSRPLVILTSPDKHTLELDGELLRGAGLKTAFLLSVDWSATDRELRELFSNWLDHARPEAEEANRTAPLRHVLGDIEFPAKPSTLLRALGVWKMKREEKKNSEIREALARAGNEENTDRSLRHQTKLCRETLEALFPGIVGA
jgi:hypothetical protein